jgi:hypothetical protein
MNVTHLWLYIQVINRGLMILIQLNDEQYENTSMFHWTKFWTWKLDKREKPLPASEVMRSFQKAWVSRTKRDISHAWINIIKKDFDFFNHFRWCPICIFIIWFIAEKGIVCIATYMYMYKQPDLLNDQLMR